MNYSVALLLGAQQGANKSVLSRVYYVYQSNYSFSVNDGKQMKFIQHQREKIFVLCVTITQ